MAHVDGRAHQAERADAEQRDVRHPQTYRKTGRKEDAGDLLPALRMTSEERCSNDKRDQCEELRGPERHRYAKQRGIFAPRNRLAVNRFTDVADCANGAGCCMHLVVQVRQIHVRRDRDEHEQQYKRSQLGARAAGIG